MSKGVPLSTLSRVRRGLAISVATALGMLAPVGLADAAPPSPGSATPAVYVVALEDLPRPGTAVRMRTAQDDLLRELGEPRLLYRFGSALNGFAAELTREQAKQLRFTPGVAFVERSTKQRLDSVDSPEFLHADQAWAATGGPEQAGRGTVVGVIDSGIWPENPSFAALPGAARGGPAGFAGGCETGESWDPADCNSKLVGARYFVKGFGEQNLAASEYLSPRDGTGHGSHVAAIAAGNHGVAVQVDGQDFGDASGMAPAARIAAYKVCWTAPDPADDGCSTADAVAAIDRAVADGVDVISYAISSAGGDSRAIEEAFLNATARGVFVAASAGNRGPGEGTVRHTSPWVTTVGASTHRLFQGAVALEGDETYVGAMVSDRVLPPTGIVVSTSAVAETSTTEDARLCLPGSLDADVVQGKIVVCDRGTIARVEKSTAVQRAGGVGMVLANVRPDSVDSDFHAVPTVHVDVAAGQAIKDFVAETADPRASFDPRATGDTAVRQLASFSSRGPAPVDGGSLLKPDLTAPGVAVLSAGAAGIAGGRAFEQRSGTSMSAGHVAGLAAFVRGERPAWTPAMVKSAMSTTAVELAGVSGPLSAGAGQVDAANLLDPGLVLDAPPRQYRAWLEGTVPTRNLNLPSIAVGDLVGRSRLVRRVTNVSGSTETYDARVLGLPGLDVRVRPRTLQLAPGETGRFVVVIDRGTAQLETPARGALVWTGLSHQARMPMVVTPRTLSTAGEVTGTNDAGSVRIEGVAGVDGELEVAVTGLAAAQPVGLTLEPGDFRPDAPQLDADTAQFPVEVPTGTALLRFELEGRDSDDLDLYLSRDGEIVASATGLGADEQLTVENPEPGEYALYVASAEAANGSTTTAQLYSWVVRDGDAGNVRVPASVPVLSGEPFSVELSWDDLDPTSRWFGAVRYPGSAEQTFVTVN